MAVLLECISVIIRTHTIHNKYPGGWVAFLQIVPNKTLCYDDEITRVGFMTPMDVEAFVKQLQKIGFSFLHPEFEDDLVVVDQYMGPTRPCTWLEIGKNQIDDEGHEVDSCRLTGSKIIELYTPVNWINKKNRNPTYNFIANEEVNSRLIFLRNENGTDVFLDKITGKDVFIGRTIK
jgi:hypothetical protein